MSGPRTSLHPVQVHGTISVTTGVDATLCCKCPTVHFTTEERTFTVGGEGSCPTVPSSAYTPEAARWIKKSEEVGLDEDRKEMRKINVNNFAGPAWKLCKVIVGVQLFTAVANMSLVWMRPFQFGQCTHNGFGYSLELLAIPFLVACFVTYKEAEAVRQIILPCIFLGPLKFATVKLGYSWWTLIYRAQTFATALSFQTNALFTISIVIEFSQCPQIFEQRGELWTELMRHSFFKFMTWNVASLGVLAFAAWVCYLFVLLPVWFWTKPCCGEQIDHNMGWKKLNIGTQQAPQLIDGETRWKSLYLRCKRSSWDMTYGEALFIWAPMANWSAVSALSTIHSTQGAKYADKGHLWSALTHCLVASSNVMIQLCTQTFLKSALQLNLQTTLFALNRAQEYASNRTDVTFSHQVQVIGPIILLLITSFATETSLLIDYVAISRRVLREAKDNVELMQNKEFVSDYNTLRCLLVIIQIAAFVFTAMIFYAFLKFIMAFWCIAGLWNFGTPHHWVHLGFCVPVQQHA